MNKGQLGNAELCFVFTVLLLNEIYLPTKFLVDTSCSLSDVLDKMWSDGQTSEWTKQQLFIHIAVPSGSVNIVNIVKTWFKSITSTSTANT